MSTTPWEQQFPQSELSFPWNDEMVYNLAKQANEKQQQAAQLLETVNNSRGEIARAFREAGRLRAIANAMSNNPQQASATLNPLEVSSAQGKHHEADAAMVQACTQQSQVYSILQSAHTLLLEATVELSTSYDRAHKLANGDAPYSDTYAGLMAQSLQELGRRYHALIRADELQSMSNNLLSHAYQLSGASHGSPSFRERKRLQGEGHALREQAEEILRTEVHGSEVAARELAQKAQGSPRIRRGMAIARHRRQGQGVPERPPDPCPAPWDNNPSGGQTQETRPDLSSLKRRSRPRRSEQDNSESEQDSTWGQKPKFLC